MKRIHSYRFLVPKLYSTKSQNCNPRSKFHEKTRSSRKKKDSESKDRGRTSGIKLPLWEHGGAWRQGSSDFYRADPGGNNASYHQLLHVPPTPLLNIHIHGEGRRSYASSLLSFRVARVTAKDESSFSTDNMNERSKHS